MMSQKQGNQNVSTDWRKELSGTQTKVNDAQKKLSDQGLEIYHMKHYIGFLRMIFKITGLGIIIFDIIKDGVSGQYRHAEGMGWMQWGLLVAGFIILAIGVYRPGRSK